jgi:hypothetical protein
VCYVLGSDGVAGPADVVLYADAVLGEGGGYFAGVRGERGRGVRRCDGVESGGGGDGGVEVTVGEGGSAVFDFRFFDGAHVYCIVGWSPENAGWGIVYGSQVVAAESVGGDLRGHGAFDDAAEGGEGVSAVGGGFVEKCALFGVAACARFVEEEF